MGEVWTWEGMGLCRSLLKAVGRPAGGDSGALSPAAPQTLCEWETPLSHLGLGVFHAQQQEVPRISGLQMFLGLPGVSTELPQDLWMVVVREQVSPLR